MEDEKKTNAEQLQKDEELLKQINDRLETIEDLTFTIRRALIFLSIFAVGVLICRNCGFII